MSRTARERGRQIAAPFVFCLLLWRMAPLVEAAPVKGATAISLAYWREEDALPAAGVADLLSAFQARYPDIRVNHNREEWTVAKTRIRYWCGSCREYAPDVIVMPEFWLAEYAEQLWPLEELLTTRELASFIPAVLARGRIKGRLKGLPWLVRSRALYYRADWLAAAQLSPPQDLEALRKTALALAKPPEIYGLGLPGAVQGGAAEAFLDLLAAQESSIFDSEGSLVWPEKTAQATLAYWWELQQAGALQPQALTWTQAELEEAFARGRLAMLIAEQDFARRLRRLAPQLRFGVAPLPCKGEPSLPITADLLVVLKSTKQIDAVRRFMRFMASSEAQRALMLMGSLPTQEGLYERVRDNKEWAPFVCGIMRARGLPLQNADSFGRVIERALWLALSGRASPAEALEQAQREEARRLY